MAALCRPTLILVPRALCVLETPLRCITCSHPAIPHPFLISCIFFSVFLCLVGSSWSISFGSVPPYNLHFGYRHRVLRVRTYYVLSHIGALSASSTHSLEAVSSDGLTMYSVRNWSWDSEQLDSTSPPRPRAAASGNSEASRVAGLYKGTGRLYASLTGPSCKTLCLDGHGFVALRVSGCAN